MLRMRDQALSIILLLVVICLNMFVNLKSVIEANQFIFH